MVDDWKSPDTVVDSGAEWDDDDNIKTDQATKAVRTILAPAGFTSYLEAHLDAEIYCDKIRFDVNGVVREDELDADFSVDVQVWYDGDWQIVYQGIVARHVGVEKWVVPGTPGKTKRVLKSRVRF